ncbi:MAG TPA: hypothetical protein VFC41_03955 [Anaerovoracaceae bacterium]|nr:hypothetical protein [Anaerovoracaceae bacterium]
MNGKTEVLKNQMIMLAVENIENFAGVAINRAIEFWVLVQKNLSKMQF